MPGASTLAPWAPFWQLGDTLGTMGAAGRTRGGPEPDLGVISGPQFESLLGSGGLDSILFGLFSTLLFALIMGWKS